MKAKIVGCERRIKIRDLCNGMPFTQELMPNAVIYIKTQLCQALGDPRTLVAYNLSNDTIATFDADRYVYPGVFVNELEFRHQ